MASDFPALLIRARASPQPVVAAVGDLLVRSVPDRPVFTGLVSDRITAHLDGVRTSALQVTAFAALGLLLALIGVYGVLAFAVSRRQREIAVRGALGATPARISGMILREAAVLASAAIAVGVSAAAASSRWIRPALHGTNPTDPAVYAIVTLVVAGFALAASYLPARRAARVAPLDALKSM